MSVRLVVGSLRFFYFAVIVDVAVRASLLQFPHLLIYHKHLQIANKWVCIKKRKLERSTHEAHGLLAVAEAAAAGQNSNFYSMFMFTHDFSLSLSPSLSKRDANKINQ